LSANIENSSSGSAQATPAEASADTTASGAVAEPQDGACAPGTLHVSRSTRYRLLRRALDAVAEVVAARGSEVEGRGAFQSARIDHQTPTSTNPPPT